MPETSWYMYLVPVTVFVWAAAALPSYTGEGTVVMLPPYFCQPVVPDSNPPLTSRFVARAGSPPGVRRIPARVMTTIRATICLRICTSIFRVKRGMGLTKIPVKSCKPSKSMTTKFHKSYLECTLGLLGEENVRGCMGPYARGQRPRATSPRSRLLKFARKSERSGLTT